ncbi:MULTISPECIES: helix-turn-helix domain-containing protein [unclassified Caballeronia]|uniref:TetR/AcrR family transcriptional regulator n=1 Tax=unclassified Caballeronia TaxID=2646786 RepID=UPI002863B23F|nr:MULTISPECIES: helix-turn-helix domain-containing protein [unclassified Caballeronia]MDR5777309.1 helix-turn-helix domain containing protein [Caballeronia sp. LZ002]MDR5852759.1 helix-turn-helix domain containing protein [Caballeronia sp. LZ003]
MNKAKREAHGSNLETVQTRPKRTRRSTGEIRRLILESARKMFANVGYARTSIRAIAENAGVLEHLVYRNFDGGKAALFEQAVFLPFETMLDAHYESTWVVRQPDMEGAVERARRYIETLYDQLSADRQLWKALVLAIQTHENELDHLLHAETSPLLRYFERLVQTVQPSMNAMGWRIDTNIAVRITFASVLSLTLFDDLLFGIKQPTREALMAEMTSYALFGVARSPASEITDKREQAHRKTGSLRSRKTIGQKRR